LERKEHAQIQARMVDAGERAGAKCSDMARILFGVTTSPLKHFYILIANAERAVAINVNSESGYDLSRCDSGDWDAEANNSHECQFFARPS
jgi:hypothetical protein